MTNKLTLEAPESSQYIRKEIARIWKRDKFYTFSTKFVKTGVEWNVPATLWVLIHRANSQLKTATHRSNIELLKKWTSFFFLSTSFPNSFQNLRKVVGKEGPFNLWMWKCKNLKEFNFSMKFILKQHETINGTSGRANSAMNHSSWEKNSNSKT